MTMLQSTVVQLEDAAVELFDDDCDETTLKSNCTQSHYSPSYRCRSPGKATLRYLKRACEHGNNQEGEFSLTVTKHFLRISQRFAGFEWTGPHPDSLPLLRLCRADLN